MAEVYMDKDAVSNIAEGFDTAGDVLKAVNMSLEAAIQLMNSNAFVGAVGGAAIQQYLNMIRPRVEDLSVTCTEMSEDLRQAVALREQAEQAGDSI